MTDSKSMWSSRLKLKRLVQSFFDHRDYLEVETPIAVLCPGTEVHLDYFATKWKDHQSQNHQLYLRSSPEIHLKKLLGQGHHRVYEFARCFRNRGELSQWHHPEFTMLEFYQSDITTPDFIDLTNQMIRESINAFGNKIPIPESTTRLSVYEAFKNFCQIDLIDGDPELGRKGQEAGCPSPQPDDDFETAFFKIIFDKIEPELKKFGLAVLMDYPPSQAALAVVEDGRAKRFEFYLNGIELSNGFNELTGDQPNRDRFAHSNKLRKSLGYEAIPGDEEFFQLSESIPSCCGNALGFDRLLALCLGNQEINGVVPFYGKNYLRRGLSLPGY